MADENENAVPQVPVSPTGKPVLPQWAVVTMSVAVVVLPAIALIPGPQQPVMVAIAGVVAGIGTLFGIVSPGLRTQTK